MTDKEWPDAALSLLDSLWATKTRMNIIRNRLMPLLGYDPMPLEVREKANRYAEAVEVVQEAAPAEPAKTKHIPTPIVFTTMAPAPRPDNRVRLVPPGTYPARGFSMLGGRFR